MYHMDPLLSEISNKNLKIQTFHEENFDNNICMYTYFKKITTLVTKIEHLFLLPKSVNQ
jgi:hypothetical protein